MNVTFACPSVAEITFGSTLLRRILVERVCRKSCHPPSGIPSSFVTEAYDRYGNRAPQTFAGGTLAIPQPVYTIDPATNRISTPGYQYDAAGNLTFDALHTYKYDVENRIAEVVDLAEQYAYDPTGLRVQKTANNSTTNYVLSGAKVLAEYVNGALSKEYINSGDALLATVSGGQLTYHYPDHLSTRLETDTAGTVTRTFGHLPFGETWYETGTASKWKFTTYERDNSGLDYANFRFYNNPFGRFMTTDPYAGSAELSNPQSLSRFSYVLNSPVDYSDSSGLGPCIRMERGPNGEWIAKEVPCSRIGLDERGWYLYDFNWGSTGNVDHRCPACLTPARPSLDSGTGGGPVVTATITAIHGYEGSKKQFCDQQANKAFLEALLPGGSVIVGRNYRPTAVVPAVAAVAGDRALDWGSKKTAVLRYVRSKWRVPMSVTSKFLKVVGWTGTVYSLHDAIQAAQKEFKACME